VVGATAKNAVFAVATSVGCAWSRSIRLWWLMPKLLVFAVALDRELNQAVEQLRVWDA
jgi:hypothetical protein